MRLPVALPAGLLALALVALPAHAQEGLGLDLSGETSTPAEDPSLDVELPDDTAADTPPVDLDAGMGLDLSGATAAPSVDLQPRFVMVGLDTTERAATAASKRWLLSLVRAVRDTNQVALSTSFSEVQERLGSDYETTLRCEMAECLSGPADTLDADLLVTGRLTREGRTWTLRLFTFERDTNTVHEDVLKGRSPRDARFLRASSMALAKRVKALARMRSVLKVNVNVPQAVVRLGDRVLGAGSLEVRMAPTEGTLFVEAPDHSTFTQPVTLAPGETVAVEAMLEFNGPAPEGPPDEALRVAKKTSWGASALLKRPALYTALVGLAAVGVGMAFGAQVKAVGDRARDANGDGVLDLTRSEYQAAQGKASLANILMMGGGAVAAGSGLWLVLVPTQSAPPPAAVSGAPGGTSTAFHVLAGGSF